MGNTAVTDIVALRGLAPSRVNAQEDLELVGIRHREFRRAPNPPPEKFAKYKSTIEKAARAVAYNPKYQPILNVSSHEYGDLLTYCLAWTTNFCAPVLAESEGVVRFGQDSKGRARLYVVGPDSKTAATIAQGERIKKLLALIESDNIHESEAALKEAQRIAGNVNLLGAVGYLTRDKTLFVTEGQVVKKGQSLMNGYELPPERDTSNDNIKLLYTHLLQRLLEFVGILYRKFYHHAPDKAASADFSFSEYTTSAGHVLDEEDDTSDDYTATHRKISIASDTARKRSAKKLLEDELGRMPHDKMVLTLETASKNSAICPDARGHAQRRLLKHKETCSQCNIQLVEPQRDTLVLPQADSLARVRDFANSVVSGTDVFDKSHIRHRNFYRQAARVLLLINVEGEKLVPTRFAHELLATEALSAEERAFFRARIEDSPSLAPYLWFFSDPNVPKGVLVADIAKRAGFTETTAKRRAVTLMQWKLYSQAP